MYNYVDKAMLCKYFFRRNVLVKRNEQQLRKDMVQSRAKEIALEVANHGITFGESEEERKSDDHVIRSIHECLYHKYRITNKKLDETTYLYYFSSQTEEGVMQIYIRKEAIRIANAVISHEYVITIPNPNIIPYLRCSKEVDEYLEKEFKIVHKEFEGERQIYFLASSNEDKIMKNAHAQIEEEEKRSKKQDDSFLRMLLSILK